MKSKINNNTVKIFKKSDVILIFLFVLFAAAFYFIFNQYNLNSLNILNSDDAVIIKLNGEIYKEASLNKNIDIEIYLIDGTWSNTVRIKDSQVYMIHANCPGGFCLRHKPLKSYDTGEIIICLPNRVTVEIKSAENPKSKNGFDAVIENR